MPLKLADATISTFDCVFDKFKVEALNNKINFILFLADNDPSTSWCPDCVRFEHVIYKRLEATPDDAALFLEHMSEIGELGGMHIIHGEYTQSLS
ncbi:hypothetical protein TB2_023023 [Malus domestica]